MDIVMGDGFRVQSLNKEYSVKNINQKNNSTNVPKYDSVEISDKVKNNQSSDEFYLGFIAKWNPEQEKILKDYYNGKCDINSISDMVEKELKEILNYCVEKGGNKYQNSLDDIVKKVYTNIRTSIVRYAGATCYSEGRNKVLDYISNNYNLDQYGDWTYYDSNYYYQSENAIDSVKESYENVAKEYGLDLSLQRDYEPNSMLAKMYTSFNTWINWENHNRGTAGACMNIIDESTIPPENFNFLYIGNSAGVYSIPTDIYGNDEAYTDLFNGMVKISYGDLSFSSIVSLPYNLSEGPLSRNLLDIIDEKYDKYPVELKNFLSNIDFFNPYYYKNYLLTHGN